MVAENVAFGIIAAGMALGAVGVVRTQNVVHAALFLVVVLAGAAAQYILLGAEFVAWVQVLVYIGAVIVLFLFGIMLTRAPMQPTEPMDNNLRLWALLPSGLLAVVLGGLLIDAFGRQKIKLDAPTPTRRSPTRSSASTSCRSKSWECCCSPRSSVPSSWPGRTDRAAQPVPPARRLPLRDRRLRRGHPAQQRARADERRAHARGRQREPRRVLRAFTTRAGQVFALFVLTIAAAEVGVGLAMVLLIYRNLHSSDLDDVDVLKG